MSVGLGDKVLVTIRGTLDGWCTWLNCTVAKKLSSNTTEGEPQ